MSKTAESTLIEALGYASVRTLPKEWDGKSDYLYAITKVRKSDNSVAYVVSTRTEEGKNVVIRDFGNVAAIVETISIHPFYEGKRRPEFRTKKERIAFLVHEGLMDEETAATLSARALEIAINKYLDDKEKTL